MSGYAETYQAAQGEREEIRTVPDKFRDMFPALALAMGGFVPEGEAKASIVAAKVTIWFEGGQLRFSLNPRRGNRIGFGVVPDATTGLVGLDHELSLGRVGWKLDLHKRPA